MEIELNGQTYLPVSYWYDKTHVAKCSSYLRLFEALDRFLIVPEH